VFSVEIRFASGPELRVDEPVLLATPILRWVLLDILGPVFDGFEALLTVSLVFFIELLT
jgi:hypothetical protein